MRTKFFISFVLSCNIFSTLPQLRPHTKIKEEIINIVQIIHCREYSAHNTLQRIAHNII